MSANAHVSQTEQGATRWLVTTHARTCGESGRLASSTVGVADCRVTKSIQRTRAVESETGCPTKDSGSSINCEVISTGSICAVPPSPHPAKHSPNPRGKLSASTRWKRHHHHHQVDTPQAGTNLVQHSSRQRVHQHVGRPRDVRDARLE